jgi:mannose-6-phosphate isomerase-like protein (cupin superfamily)
MRLGDEEADIRAGDTIVIPPGVKHKLWNPGAEPLVLLCCCSPAYSHEDTVLLEGE